MSAAERRSLGSPASTWTRQGCMLVPLGARAAPASAGRRAPSGALRSPLRRSRRRSPSRATPSLLRDAHHELAEVLSLEQAHEGLGRVVEALDHVLAVLDPALAQPLADFRRELA